MTAATAIARDPVIRSATAAISLRSEQEQDPRRPDIFVDPGVIDRLDNVNHQILYGRRGTGKTHLLQRVRSLLTDRGHAAVFLDARTFGSSNQFMNEDEPVGVRCTALFRDFLADLHNQLLEIVVYRDAGNAAAALEELDKLADGIMTNTNQTSGGSYNVSRSREEGTGSDASIELGTEPKLTLGTNGKTSRSYADEVTVEFTTDDRLVFPAVSQHLANVLRLSGNLHLYVLLDEWSALPRDIQPFVAEFLKRCMLPVPGVTVKIAAVEYRTHFQGTYRDREIGFELGADVSTAIDLDDHYVWEGNERNLETAYSEILFGHLSYQIPRLSGSASKENRLGFNYLKAEYSIANSHQLVEQLFGDGAFNEICEASSGVVRDFLALTGNAIRDLHLRSQWHSRDMRVANGDDAEVPVIEGEDDQVVLVSRIRRVGKEWFERDKIDHLSTGLKRRLDELERVCLHNLKSRFFLVRADDDVDEDIAKLLDARVLHRVVNRYSHPSSPGERYDVYGLDYGSYMSVYMDDRGPADPRRTGKHIDGIRRSFSQVDNPLRLRYLGPRGLEPASR